MVSAPSKGEAIAAPSIFEDAPRTGLTADDLLDGITEHLFFTLGRSASTASPHDLYMALSHAVRDRLMSRHLAYEDEASGTGNMKFAMNGAVTIGTLDGANVEIMEQVGQENFVPFGHTTEQIQDLRRHDHPREWLHRLPLLQEAFLLVKSDHFSHGDRDMFQPLMQQLISSDPFFLLADVEAYLEAQDRVDAAWREPGRWQRMGLRNMARSGFFSSDRAVRTDADQIWSLQAAPVDMTCPLPIPTP